MKKLTLNQFIEKASNIHNNFYDYSNTIYINQDTKIKIICPKHGEFKQRPDHHLRGHECKFCSTKSYAHIQNNKISGEDFIKTAIKMWNGYYDYSKVNYITAKNKVVIICPKHGKFMQTPDNHIKHKCLKCSIEENANNQRRTTDEFIAKSKSIHGNKYDYSKVFYKGNREKIEIICPTHGSWWQTPYNHLQDRGCTLCKHKSKGEIKIMNFLKNHSIIFIREKTFNDCINSETKAKLKFDFYVPKHNLCIEYDGKQHFEASDFFGGEVGLIKTQKRDKIKNEYCKLNNIFLLRINYKENLIRKLNSVFSKIIS